MKYIKTILFSLFLFGTGFGQDLTGERLPNTYQGILHLSGNGGVTGSLLGVYGGVGTVTAFEVSSAAFNVTGTFTVGGVNVGIAKCFNVCKNFSKFECLSRPCCCPC